MHMRGKVLFFLPFTEMTCFLREAKNIVSSIGGVHYEPKLSFDHVLWKFFSL